METRNVPLPTFERILPSRFNWRNAASDVFLLPSATESFGLAALEAMACGVPVVASDVGGLPEVIVHGETGWLAPVGDVAAMAGHVLGLLRDRARWQRMSAAGLERVTRLFQASAAVDAYEAVYRQVMKR